MRPTVQMTPSELSVDTSHIDEETLVVDSRASISPSQSVEDKLVHLLKTPMPVSHMRLARPVRR